MEVPIMTNRRASRRGLLRSLSISWCLLAAGAAIAGEVPPHATITSLAYAGTGCPAGTVAENLSPDLKAFTLRFEAYVAEVGPRVPFNEARKNCQLTVDIEAPPGWSYSIGVVDYRGYVALEAGVEGVQSAAYYFQGQSATGRLHTVMKGPKEEDYRVTDTLGLEALVWSPCGAQRALNINSEVRVVSSRHPDGAGLITLDSLDGRIEHVYGIRWQRCSDL
jgi:hypothetical protein